MDDMQVLMISEESREQIDSIKRSPITLQFGKYKIVVDQDSIKYFLYVWQERLVEKLSFVTRVTSLAKLLMSSGRDGEFAYTHDTEELYCHIKGQWKLVAKGIKCDHIQLSTEIRPAAVERHLEEIEVDREAWINA